MPTKKINNKEWIEQYLQIVTVEWAELRLWQNLRAKVKSTYQFDLFLVLQLMHFQNASGHLCLCLEYSALQVCLQKKFQTIKIQNHSAEQLRKVERLQNKCNASLKRIATKEFILLQFSQLLCKSNYEAPLFLLCQNEPCWLYFHKHYYWHWHSFAFLLDCENNPVTRSDKKSTRIAIREITKKHPQLVSNAQTKNPLKLSAMQLQALQQTLGQRISVISGGPGTGKTTLVFSILRAYLRLGYSWDQILLAAPTGKSAQRLTEAIAQGLQLVAEPDPQESMLAEIRAYTIHSIISTFPNSLPASLIVIDEASMIDSELFYRLCQKIDPAHTQLIICGDMDQLAAVQPGAILQDITNWIACNALDNCSHIRLQQGYRNQALIASFAQRILAADTTLVGSIQTEWQGLESIFFQKQPSIQIYAYPQDSDTKFVQYLKGWIDYVYPESLVECLIKLRKRESPDTPDELNDDLVAAYHSINSRRILGFSYEHQAGLHRINQYCQQLLQRKLGLSPGSRSLHANPILITRNDSSLGLANGDSGIILQNENGLTVACFLINQKIKVFPLFQIQHFEIAFAHTVHKSQGSEFESALIILPPQDQHPLLGRQILYTAITRVKRHLLLLTRASTLLTCMKQSNPRQTGPLALYFNPDENVCP